MASGMKGWIAAALGGIILMALWALPPRDQESYYALFYQGRFRPAARPVETVAYGRLFNQVARDAEAYQHLRWRDSLAVLAREAREGGGGIIVSLPGDAPPGYRERLQEAVEVQLRALGVEEPRVPVGVALWDAAALAHPWQRERGGRLLPHYREELIVSSEEADPYCVVMAPLARIQSPAGYQDLEQDWRRMVATPSEGSPPNPLGPCALHARFGNPGRGIAPWLWSRGYAFALGYGERWAGGRTMEEMRGRDRRRGLLGVRPRYWGLTPEAEGCLVGRDEGCRRVVVEAPGPPYFSFGQDPVTSGEGPPLFLDLRRYRRGMAFAGHELDLLSQMEEAFGSHRFQRFWSSELPVEEAFEAAFGVPLSSWTMEWARSRLGPLRAGPSIPPGAALLTLLLLALLAGAAVLVQQRRG